MITEQKINEFIANQEKALADFKSNLLKEINPKQEFETGKWYYFEHDNGDSFLAKFSRLDEYKFYYSHYAPLNYKNLVWYENNWCNISILKRPATEAEVFEALKKEAEKRGFKIGVTIDRNGLAECKNDPRVVTINKGDFDYNKYRDYLAFGDRIIYSQGKWAEIVKEEKITICDKEVIFKASGIIEINGCSYVKEELQMLKTLMNKGQVKSLNVGCNGQEKITVELINKLIDGIVKKMQ